MRWSIRSFNIPLLTRKLTRYHPYCLGLGNLILAWIKVGIWTKVVKSFQWNQSFNIKIFEGKKIHFFNGRWLRKKCLQESLSCLFCLLEKKLTLKSSTWVESTFRAGRGGVGGGGNVEANLLMHKAQAEKKKALFITQIIKKLIKSKNHK